jgi:hypothetical protein
MVLSTGHREAPQATYKPQDGYLYAGDAGYILEVGLPVDKNLTIFLPFDNIGAQHGGISMLTTSGEVGILQCGVSTR